MGTRSPDRTTSAIRTPARGLPNPTHICANFLNRALFPAGSTWTSSWDRVARTRTRSGATLTGSSTSTAARDGSAPTARPPTRASTSSWAKATSSPRPVRRVRPRMPPWNHAHGWHSVFRSFAPISRRQQRAALPPSGRRAAPRAGTGRETGPHREADLCPTHPVFARPYDRRSPATARS